MALGSQERQDSQADRKRLHRIEAAGLALLLLRRRNAANGAHPEAALLAGVTDAILGIRRTAREFGRETVASRFAINESVAPVANLLDATRAAHVARAHLLHVNTEVANARAEDVADPWATALKETKWRAETIAATEAHEAANTERIDAAREASAATGVELLQEWNAEGDACPDCGAMDGETAPIDGNFSNGLSPGSAHPRCRCWVEILTKR